MEQNFSSFIIIINQHFTVHPFLEGLSFAVFRNKSIHKHWKTDNLNLNVLVEIHGARRAHQSVRLTGALAGEQKCAAFEKQSAIVKITVWLLENGRPVTKSTAMCDHGCRGMDSRLSKPEGG